MLLGISALMTVTGCAAAHQSTRTVLQESTYGDRFSYDPNSIKQTTANTFRVLAGTDSVTYLYEIDCAGRKARILENDHIDPTWFDIRAGSGDELVYTAVCQRW